MEEKNLYIDFKKDKKIYNLNQGFWKKKFQNKLNKRLTNEDLLFENLDKNRFKIYDANPIFTYLDKGKSKAIRIIQDEIDDYKKEEIDISNLLNTKILISAWLDKIYIYDSNDNENIINELVIALLLTKDTINVCMKLIEEWLNDKLTQETIDMFIDKYPINENSSLNSFNLIEYLNKNSKYSYFACFINLDKYRKYNLISLNKEGYVGDWNISNNRTINKLLIYVRENNLNSIYEANFVTKKLENNNKYKLFFKDLKFLAYTHVNWTELTNGYNSFRYYNSKH